ncbi:MAG: hypothetical protein BWK79_18380 [Beggiatoa sp. IS2]|nr:MAG: hypothetical protein BWK79_18380 [Beggiatoa sp. IS2]
MLNFNKRIALFWALLVGATAITAFWQIQIPENVPMSPEKEIWQELKLPATEEVETTLATLKRFKLWGDAEMAQGNPNKAGKNASTTASTATGAAGKQPLSWQLVGIVQQGHQRRVLLLDNATQKISAHSVENTLPGEVNLIAIHDDAIEIKQEGKIETLRLYQ